MANTTTGSLADSKQFIIDSARSKREFEGVFKRTCDNKTLAKNTGLSWDEITLDQLTAQAVTETTVLDNPQTLSDSLFSITPTVSGITTVITDRVYNRLARQTIAEIGPLAQNAIQRKKDEDYLATFASATTTLGGTGTTLAAGVIDAGVVRISSNTTEPVMGPYHVVLHGYQIKDLADEIRAGIGTYALPAGMTEQVYKRGFRGITEVSSANIWEDGNIAINSTPDARGGVHAQTAIVMVQGHSPRMATVRREEIGGGADQMFYYDEYAYGERYGGIALYSILTDASTPTT